MLQNYKPSLHIQLVTLLAVVLALSAGWLLEKVEEGRWGTKREVRHSARCIRIIDGDTVEVLWGIGDRDKVRVLGIDCPEIRPSEKLGRQARALNVPESMLLELGQEARSLAGTWLMNRDVKLVFPRGEIERDVYDRLLCYIEFVGKDYGRELLEKGLAEARRESHPRVRQYKRLDEKARAMGVGIHARGWMP